MAAPDQKLPPFLQRGEVIGLFDVPEIMFWRLVERGRFLNRTIGTSTKPSFQSDAEDYLQKRVEERDQ